MEATNLDSWEIDLINYYLENAGTRVTDEVYEARIKTCNGCDFYGDVFLPSGPQPGCTKCKCPSATKPKFEKYFHPIKLRVKVIKCPEGFWEN